MTTKSSMQKTGYIFLCSDATEEECLETHLLGYKTKSKQLKDLEVGDTVYLYNFNSKRLHGPYITTTQLTENLEPSAWQGIFPWQVRFSVLKKYLPIHRDVLVGLLKFSRKGWPAIKVTAEQMIKLEMLFMAEHRHRNYDDSAALVTHDGHKVRSKPELEIDNWLFAHRVAHAYEYPIPDAKRCDFYIPIAENEGVYIEYWGLNDEKYLKDKVEKQKIYKEHKLKLVEIEHKDLKNLDKILTERLLIGRG